jgi:hypothetical protein
MEAAYASETSAHVHVIEIPKSRFIIENGKMVDDS